MNIARVPTLGLGQPVIDTKLSRADGILIWATAGMLGAAALLVGLRAARARR